MVEQARWTGDARCVGRLISGGQAGRPGDCRCGRRSEQAQQNNSPEKLNPFFDEGVIFTFRRQPAGLVSLEV